jgi:hypothetical protein
MVTKTTVTFGHFAATPLAMDDSVECPECARLRTRHESLRTTYTAARDLLLSGAETETTARIHLLRRAAADAQLDWAIALSEFEEHSRSHR